MRRYHENLPSIISNIVPDEQGCRSWPHTLDRDGYPLQHIDGKQWRLHRWILERKLGRSILPDHMSLHTCDNPSCVEESHLFEGTHSDNMKDMCKKGRNAHNLSELPRGSDHHSATLTEARVLAARRLKDRGFAITVIAEVFCVKPRALYRAVRGITWSHVI
jgi:hypothetical protein